MTTLAVASLMAMLGLYAFAGSSSARTVSSVRCHSFSKHHFKTPHRDGDGDKCDRHGVDDGDGATV
jgi:hypothetical protein